MVSHEDGALPRRRWMRPQHFCAYADIGPVTLYKWIKEGTVRSIKRGAVRLIDSESLEKDDPDRSR